MKNKKYTIILILFVGNFSFSQGRFNTYQSDLKYTARSYDEMARLPMEMRRRHDNNLEYLYRIQEWIIKLKSEIKDEYYLEILNSIYGVLDKEKKGGLANSYSALKEVELFIKDKVVNEYNKEIEKKSNINDNYEKALKVNDADILFMRALKKSEQGDCNGAIEDYDMIIKLRNTVKLINYKMSTVYNNKAYCLVEFGNYTDALPLVNKALELDKSEGYIWDTRGELYYKIKQYQKCVSDMNNAILIKESGNSYYYRGLAQLKLGKKVLGCKDLSKAEELGMEEANEAILKYCQ